MQVAGVFEMLKNSDYTASLSENICFESQPETQSFQFRILRPLEFRYIRQSDHLTYLNKQYITNARDSNKKTGS